MDNGNFGFLLKDNLYLTIRLSAGKASFDIYDSNSCQIYQDVLDSILKNFDRDTFERFEKRCENMIKALSKGIPVNMGQLTKAWEEAIKDDTSFLAAMSSLNWIRFAASRDSSNRGAMS